MCDKGQRLCSHRGSWEMRARPGWGDGSRRLAVSSGRRRRLASGCTRGRGRCHGGLAWRPSCAISFGGAPSHGRPLCLDSDAGVPGRSALM